MKRSDRSRPTRWAKSLTDSLLVQALFVIVGLASIVLVFGFTRTKMYGVELPINLIAYWHIAFAWTGGVALFVTFVGSAMYLYTRDRYWNLLAHSAGEIGFLFITVALVMGSAWGSEIWGQWWSWNSIRLVTMFVAWLVYAGYLVVYNATVNMEGRFVAAYGVIGFVTVPLSFMSTRIWNPYLHNPTIDGGRQATIIEPVSLVVSIVAITLLFIYMVSVRFRMHTLSDAVRTALEGR